MTLAYLALGSNLGDRAALIAAALAELAAAPGVASLRAGPVIETAPVGPPGQGPYLNTACVVETSLPPRELLELAHRIEARLGRDRAAETVRWGPRRIDIDLLLHGAALVNEPDLTVPHPQMHLRRFVLEPLAQVAPEAFHPGLKRTAAQLLAALDQPPPAKKLDSAGGM